MTLYKILSVYSYSCEDSWSEGEIEKRYNYDRFDDLNGQDFVSLEHMLDYINDEYDINFTFDNAAYEDNTLMLNTYLTLQETIPTDKEEEDFKNDKINFLNINLELTIVKISDNLDDEFKSLGICYFV